MKTVRIFILMNLMWRPIFSTPTELPPAVKTALTLLASSKQADAISRMLRIMLIELSEDAPFEFEDPRPIGVNWKSGVDHLESLDPKAAWKVLGLREERIPFMVTRIDSVGGRTTWTAEGKAWFDERKPSPSPGEPAHEDQYVNGEPFNLLWHQVIGVIRMLEIGFEGELINEIAHIRLIFISRREYNTRRRSRPR